jgi:hypothetical protein
MSPSGDDWSERPHHHAHAVEWRPSAAAISAASSYAAQLDRDVDSHTPESLSVYGSLLLRGAVAAAQRGDRGMAHELLDETDEAAKRLGVEGNFRWTAFGPINSTLHRVNRGDPRRCQNRYRCGAQLA